MLEYKAVGSGCRLPVLATPFLFKAMGASGIRASLQALMQFSSFCAFLEDCWLAFHIALLCWSIRRVATGAAAGPAAHHI